MKAVLALILIVFLPGQLVATSKCFEVFQDDIPAFSLANHRQKLLIGLAVEYNNGKIALGVADYFFSSHREIFEEAANFGHISKVLWAGELLIKDAENTRQAKVVATINTSGFALSLFKDQNEPENLKRILTLLKPSLITPTTKYLFYSDRKPHLDPLFCKLNENNCNDSVRARHNIINLITAVFAFFNPITFGEDWASDIKYLHSDMPAEVMKNFVILCRSLLKYSTDRVTDSTVRGAAIYFKKFEENKIKNKRDFQTLLLNINRFEAEYLKSRLPPTIILLN